LSIRFELYPRFFRFPFLIAFSFLVIILVGTDPFDT
jgi:hypothetical protein